VTEYDFEHLEYLISNVQEGEMEPEEAIAAFRRHLLEEHGVEPEQLI
jgi:recombinational DNA repair protein (RecF pathway)